MIRPQPVILETIGSLVLVFLFWIARTKSVTFEFTPFLRNDTNLSFEGDALVANDILQLTANRVDASLTGSKGRASYAYEVPLWDNVTNNLTDFTTSFSFIITPLHTNSCGESGDGLSFFMAPVNAKMPVSSSGGGLGLMTPKYYNDTSKNQIVAVEIDTFQNYWDPNALHLGIDVNELVSVATTTLAGIPYNGLTGESFITYDSTTKNLSVSLSYSDGPDGDVPDGSASLSYGIDLSTVLPENVKVGLSASTGTCIELHEVLSWNFSSTLQIREPAPAPTPEAVSGFPAADTGSNKSKHKPLISPTSAILGSLAFATVAGAFALCWFTHWRRRSTSRNPNFEVDEDFEGTAGPMRFTYRELSQATNNFHVARKLGEGGFGSVYRGLLQDPSTDIAVKRVSEGSRQGKKEYVSEIKIISRLGHRNLVKLLGWCHERGDLLLVYEFMENGSLDAHLFGPRPPLPWYVRHRIALGLASALLYLHEEGEQYVVHRDIKSSNIMLDSNFNPKLGDFGLARLVDHDLGSQTTVLAGTRGYLAPECAITGKPSKESDIYSFGVVFLEIATGKRPLFNIDNRFVTLVPWVWNVYGKGNLLEVIDQTLDGDFGEEQAERVLMVGLWCCHPDQTRRPSIRQALKVLNFEARVPTLPAVMPAFVYYEPPMQMSGLIFASSSGTWNTTASSAGGGIAPAASSGNSTGSGL
ncbi:L-type lectin-domain containing receptor kinase IX.1-like protein [Drosera capensis]